MAAVLALAASPVFADCQKRAGLRPSASGSALGASGKTDVRARGAQQKFKVEMEAAVADGSTFVVWANGLSVGTLTMRLGEAQLELNNNNGNVLPAGTDPVCSITAVAVTDGKGNPLLEGNL